jgi:hypothetical protein
MARQMLVAPEDSGLVDLPAHEFVDGKCVHCGEEPAKSFEEYVDFWWEFEYEGEPGHVHESQDLYEYLAASCLMDNGHRV